MDGRLSSLVKEGECPDSVLLETWSDLQQQYSDAIGGAEKDHVLTLIKQIHSLEFEYKTIHLFYSILENCYVNKLCDELNKVLKTSFKFDYTNPESYRKDLDRCLKRSKSIRMELALKQAQYDGVQKKFVDQKPTREYFVNILAALSDYKAYRIDDSITTYEFCYRVKQLSEKTK